MEGVLEGGSERRVDWRFLAEMPVNPVVPFALIFADREDLLRSILTDLLYFHLELFVSFALDSLERDMWMILDEIFYIEDEVSQEVFLPFQSLALEMCNLPISSAITAFEEFLKRRLFWVGLIKNAIESGAGEWRGADTFCDGFGDPSGHIKG